MKKLKKSKEIYDAHITHISLVDKGANQEEFLITKADNNKAGEINFSMIGEILSTSVSKQLGEGGEEKHYVTGIVYKPGERDAHDEFMTSSEIEKMAHEFMKNQGEVDRQHTFQSLEGAAVVESYVTKSETTINGKVIPVGTWMATVEIQDQNIWKDIQSGKITGFSMGGVGKRKEGEVRKEEGSLLDDILKALKLKKEKGDNDKFDKDDGIEVQLLLRKAEHLCDGIEGLSDVTESIRKAIEELDKIEPLAKGEDDLDRNEVQEIVTKSMEENNKSLLKQFKDIVNPPKSQEEIAKETMTKVLKELGLDKKEEGNEQSTPVAKKVSEMTPEDLAKFIDNTVNQLTKSEEKELTTEDLANMVAKALDGKGVSRQIESEGGIQKADGTPSWFDPADYKY